VAVAAQTPETIDPAGIVNVYAPETSVAAADV
jgi:hypothetical protein